jgi:hypothetical protein
MTTLGRHARLLNPLVFGLFAVQLWSHKVARWLVPFFLAGLLVSSAWLAPASPFFATVLVLQAACYGLALLALARVPPIATWRLPRIALYFLIVNASVALAWSKYLAGVRQEVWAPSRR